MFWFDWCACSLHSALQPPAKDHMPTACCRTPQKRVEQLQHAVCTRMSTSTLQPYLRRFYAVLPVGPIRSAQAISTKAVADFDME
jgi:hypothetical protein